MINGLDSSNPTQLLLSAIRIAGIDILSPSGSFKNNEEFSLGLVSSAGEVHIILCLFPWERNLFILTDISHVQNNCW
jgi:hypothetical protein